MGHHPAMCLLRIRIGQNVPVDVLKMLRCSAVSGHSADGKIRYDFLEYLFVVKYLEYIQYGQLYAIIKNDQRDLMKPLCIILTS